MIMNGAFCVRSGARCNFLFWFHESFMKLIVLIFKITHPWECRIKQGSDNYFLLRFHTDDAI